MKGSLSERSDTPKKESAPRSSDVRLLQAYCNKHSVMALGSQRGKPASTT